MTCFFARTLDTRSKFRVFNLKGQQKLHFLQFFYRSINPILYSYHYYFHYLKFPFSIGAKK